MSKEYYFDNSATSNPKPDIVIEKVTNALINLNANPGRSAYDKAVKINREIFCIREKIANFFNINNPLQIAFTKNASESLNMAIKGYPFENSHIITSVFEHNSVLRPLHFLEQEKNVELSFILPEHSSESLKKSIISKIKRNTKAIIINHISNVTGNIFDIDIIGKICKDYGLLFILDASQSAGFLDIDVLKSNIDILCFTGHKSLFGIQGIGGIYINENTSLSPLLEGGTGSFSKLERQPSVMPEALECGTLNTPGIISLGAGIDYINSIGLDKIRNHESELTKLFIENLKNVKNLIIYGDLKKDRGPVVSLNIKNVSSSEFSSILSENFNICTRSGFHCAPLAHKFLETYEKGTVRFSFGYNNTEEEIIFATNKIKDIANFFNKRS
ncbi:MAG: aminotransferase class V-fold PLP-dependent enzyme [Fusobacterium sp. JB021]|nr:aminotransferase class V-fold PLP-dependent enzyme [Fusobacterium sp. JB021]MDP0507235.1 aminotransferase class V-fold PLP-dependent enzyme [Fusobacterium sp. JB019]